MALLPGIGTAPIVAASLALRLIAIGTELVALGANKLAARRHPAPVPPTPPSETLIVPEPQSGEPVGPGISRW